jgi:6-phosphogluconolactonase (cycloisomerase 2 family)
VIIQGFSEYVCIGTGLAASSFMTTRLVLVGSLYAACLLGQGTFVYTDNNRVPNSVSGFSVTLNGALIEIPGSPFLTGGNGTIGGLFVATRITTVKNFLYAANAASNNVSAFSINPSTGALAAVPGSPFATEGVASEISLAATPDGKFLMALNTGPPIITAFSISPNGALTPVDGSPFSVGDAVQQPLGMKITPNGRFVAVSHQVLGTQTSGNVAMFGISATGRITPVPGSPFAASVGAQGIDCNCASTHLYVVSGTFNSTRVDAFNISSGGVLSTISGSPFIGPGITAQVAFLSPDDNNLFVSNQGFSTVAGFNVEPNGSLVAAPGSPFRTFGVNDPTSMGTNQEGTVLYVAGSANTVGALHIAPNGALINDVPGAPFNTGFGNLSWSLSSLAVFPPKSCCPAPVITGASATPKILWPPNQEYVNVTIDYTVTNTCPNTCVLTVASNEPRVDDKEPAWVVLDAHHLLLRAERLGSGNGRVYTITITCTNDTNKESSTQTVTVLVPHDQRK